MQPFIIIKSQEKAPKWSLKTKIESIKEKTKINNN